MPTKNLNRFRPFTDSLRWIILAVGLLVSFALFYAARETENARIAAELERRSDWWAFTFESQLRIYVDPVVLLGHIVAAYGVPSQEQFDALAFNLFDGLPIRRLVWAPLIEDAGREQFEIEESVRRKTSYEIKELNSDGQLITSARRPRYFPLRFEFFPGGLPSMMGIDPYFDPSRRAAMDKARDGGRPAGVQPVMQAAHVRGDPLFEIYLPIYLGGAVPPTIDNRRSTLIGYVGGQYFLADMLNQAMSAAPGNLVEVSFKLHPRDRAEPPAPTAVLIQNRAGGYMTSPNAGAYQPGGRAIQRSFDLLDHRMNLRMEYSAEVVAAMGSWTPSMSLSSGLLVTALLFLGFTRIGVELTHTGQALLKAQQIGQLGHWEIDRKRNRVAVSPNLIALFDLPPSTTYSSEEILDRIHPEDRDTVIASRNRALNTRSPVTYELRWRRRNGEYRWFHTVVTVRLDARGSPVSLFGLSIDITDRKQLEAERLHAQTEFSKTAKELKLISDTVPTTIAHVDRDCRYIFANEAYGQLYDVTPQEIVGRHVREVVGQRIWEDAQHFIQRAFAGECVGREYDVTDKNGVRRTYHVRSTPVLDEGRDVIGLISSGVEVTELRRTHQEFLETKQRFDTFMQNSPIAAFYKDEIGRISYANPAYHAAFSFLGEGWQEKTEAEFWPADVAASIRKTDLATLKQGRPMRIEETLPHPDGLHQWIFYKFPFQDMRGDRFVGSIGIDVTTLRSIEEQLRQAQKMEAVGQLTGGIAHDFNNLLAIVVGNAELALAETHVSDHRHELMTAALEAALRGGQLTRQLLAFSRRQTLVPKVVHLPVVLDGLGRLLKRTLGSSIAIDIIAPPFLPPCFVDQNQLETAIINLAVNARDAMPDGGRLVIEARRAISDTSETADAGEEARLEFLEIRIEDTGTGMTNEVQQRMLEPFFTTKEIGKGSGLGLPMVYGFVTQSGGRLLIDSAVGRGTNVTLQLPVAQFEAASATELANFEEATSYQPENKTVLIVEDEPGVRDVATSHFRALGFKVLVSQDANDALYVMRRTGNIDLLFTDISLPGGRSGIDLAADARRLTPSIEIVFTSGYSQSINRSAPLSELDGPLIPKPYRLAELRALVGRIFGDPST